MTLHRYCDDVLRSLSLHGVQPKPTTPPELVREFVNDLYRYELRVLRDRLLRKEFPKSSYVDRVVELRRKYSILSLRINQWTE